MSSLLPPNCMGYELEFPFISSESVGKMVERESKLLQKPQKGQCEKRLFRAVKPISSTCQTACRSILKDDHSPLGNSNLRFGTQEYVTVIFTG